MTTTIIADIEKEIVYDRETRDYACYVTVDGERIFLGYAPHYSAGESKCNQYAYEYLTDTHTYETAAELLMQVAA
jgi:hypothetical protein